MIKNNKNGISLIVLVITIVVIIILASVVIMTLTNNNPIESASKAKFLNNVRSYETELQLYQQKGFADNIGQYNPSTLQADAKTVTYAGQAINDKTIYDILPSLNSDEEYKDKFIILDGELVYTGVETREVSWLDDINVKTSTAEPIADISAADINILKKEVKYSVTFTSNYPLSKMNLDNNIKIVDENNVELTEQPTITIGQLSGSDSDKVRSVEITIDSSTLGDSKYKLMIKAGAVKNSNNIFNTQDIISNSSFSVDNIAPINPNMSAEPTTWTNVSVKVTITYTEDSELKEFSMDGTTWNSYVNPIEIFDNNQTVYARATDTSGNQSGQSTLTVANIDKMAPTVEFGTNGSNDVKEATTTVTLSDLGGSNIDPDTLQYVWDIQDATEPTASWSLFTNGQALTKNSETGTYYLWVKGSDYAGNGVITKSNAFGLDNTAPTNPSMMATPTGWTNSDVSITITYPNDATVKEYSLDGTTWNMYTTSVTVTTNNTTVYAKATDAAGNQSGQSTLTVANIDKVAPTVTAGNGGNTTSSVTITASASDIGGSALNLNSYQYSKDNGVTWTAATNTTSYTFATLATGTYECKVKVSDNAGNIATSSSVSISTTAVGTISMVASPTGWTNGNVTVTITYPSEIVTKQYNLDGTNWNAYSSAITMTANGTVYARGYDAGNNQTAQASITIANIDKTLPVVSFNPGSTALTNNDVSVTVNATDAGGSAMKMWRYRLSSDNGTTYGTWQGVNTGFDPTQTYTLTGGVNVPVLSGPDMKLTQNQNYRLEFDYKIASGSSLFNVDLWPDDLPEIHPTATTTLQHYIWNNVTANSANMNNAKLRLFNDIVRPNPADIYISNINLYPQGSHNILLNSTGDWKIQIEATDNANNVTTVTSNLYSLDKTAPTNPTMVVNPTSWTNGNVSVTITYPGDATTKQYSLDGTNWNTYTSAVSVVNNNTTVYARAYDAAGNQSGQSTLTVTNIDKTAPSIVATYKKADGSTYNSDIWTNQSVTITAAGNDNGGSGINKYQITYDGSNFYDLPGGTVTLSSTTRTGVWVRAIDNVGNVGPLSTTYIVSIDKTVPAVTYGTNGASNVQTASTTVTVSNSGGSGINAGTLQYVWDTQNSTTPNSGWATFTNGSTLTKGSVTGTYYLWIKASDNAGNSIVTKSNAFIIAAYYAFSYTGNYQIWTASSTGKIKIEVWGAMGATPMGDPYYSGKGGYASGELNITAGETLYVYVGAYGANGGWNGGAKNTYQSSPNPFTGGGATDVRRGGTALTNRIIVGGGGGAGGGWESRGGDGGGLVGNNGTSISTYSGNRFGSGGTQTYGGAGGTSTTYANGVSGSLGIGGTSTAASGGGGGGYYGGGGGTGINADDGGGGGGSSYVGGVLNGTTTTGANTDQNGRAAITYIP